MLDIIRNKKAFICDMDGVIYHGSRLLDGAREFLGWIRETQKEFLFLTNSSERSPRQLRQKLLDMGLDIAESCFMTSAISTALFISQQTPGARVYAIGAHGLTEALLEYGCVITDKDPDYVVLGETREYNYEKIEKAIQLVIAGAKLIGTNPDLTGPSESGIVPACKSLMAPIEFATGKQAYFIGKPNPLIMRNSLKKLGCCREDTAIIGDRMDTDIIAGIESEIHTILVLSGITSEQDIKNFPYRPSIILSGVGDIPGNC